MTHLAIPMKVDALAREVGELKARPEERDAISALHASFSTCDAPPPPPSSFQMLLVLTRLPFFVSVSGSLSFSLSLPLSLFCSLSLSRWRPRGAPRLLVYSGVTLNAARPDMNNYATLGVMLY